MSDFPEPMTPAECNLQDFAFMPLDVGRLRDSELAANEAPEACWAAVLIWAASWHQEPAASIPDDDMWIAKVAGYQLRGKIDKAWKGVRAGALRGWVKCSDGRLYHPVVAEKALESWKSKLERKARAEHENDRKRREREDRERMFAQLRSAGQTPDWNIKTTELRRLVAGLGDGFDGLDQRDLSRGQVIENGVTDADESRLRQGQGQGQGQGDFINSVANATDGGGAPPAPPTFPPLADPADPAKPGKEKSPEEMAKAELWRAAVSVLEQGGCPAPQARPFMGKLVKDYGQEIVRDAVAAAVTTQPADAREYLKATCQHAAGQRQHARQGVQAQCKHTGFNEAYYADAGGF